MVLPLYIRPHNTHTLMKFISYKFNIHNNNTTMRIKSGDQFQILAQDLSFPGVVLTTHEWQQPLQRWRTEGVKARISHYCVCFFRRILQNICQFSSEDDLPLSEYIAMMDDIGSIVRMQQELTRPLWAKRPFKTKSDLFLIRHICTQQHTQQTHTVSASHRHNRTHMHEYRKIFLRNAEAEAEANYVIRPVVLI